MVQILKRATCWPEPAVSAQADAAGIVLGALVPIILTSRASTAHAPRVVAVMVSAARRKSAAAVRWRNSAAGTSPIRAGRPHVMRHGPAPKAAAIYEWWTLRGWLGRRCGCVRETGDIEPARARRSGDRPGASLGSHSALNAGPSHWPRENTFRSAGCSINQIRDTVAEADEQFGVAVTERDGRGIVVHTDAFFAIGYQEDAIDESFDPGSQWRGSGHPY